MFDANNNYSPPDAETRHVVVANKAFSASLAGNPKFKTPIAAGQVVWVGMLGATHVGVISPAMPAHGSLALIEHATAKVGDVLPESEVTAAVATQAVKLASVKASQEARKAAKAA